MIRPTRSLLLAALVVAVLAACVPSDDPDPTASPSPSATPTATPTATASPTPTATPTPSATSTPPPPVDDPPQRVSGVTTMMGGGSGEVLVRWTQNPEADVVSYIVYRASTPGGASTRVGTASRHDVEQFEYVPFVDSTATVGYYRVRAVDAAGQEGPKSAEVCGAAPGYSC